MAFRFTFTVDGKPQFDRAFQRLDGAVKDFKAVWDEVRDEFYDILSDQFQSGGAAGASGKWAELSTAYEKVKIAKYGTFAIIAGVLRATDKLYKALTRHTSDSVFESSKDEMVFGTSLPYAVFHQRGDGNLPQREIFSFSDKQKRSLQKRIQKKLLEVMKQTGFEASESNFRDVL